VRENAPTPPLSRRHTSPPRESRKYPAAPLERPIREIDQLRRSGVPGDHDGIDVLRADLVAERRPAALQLVAGDHARRPLVSVRDRRLRLRV
jgi:hypothetical protein